MRSLVDPPHDISGEQQLACAVIRQALEDARASSATSARTWLIRGEELAYWCAIAGIDADVVRRRAAARLASRRMASRR